MLHSSWKKTKPISRWKSDPSWSVCVCMCVCARGYVCVCMYKAGGGGGGEEAVKYSCSVRENYMTLKFK